MHDHIDTERAQDLEMRLRSYEALERQPYWPGVLGAADWWGALALTLVLLLGALAWGV